MLKFEKNLNTFDRISRSIVALLLLTLFFVGHVRGILGVLLIVVSVLFLLVSIFSYCPFYKSINVSNYKIHQDVLDEEL